MPADDTRKRSSIGLWLANVVRRAHQEAAAAPMDTPAAAAEEPEYLKGIFRGIHTVEAPALSIQPRPSVEDSRRTIRESMDEYLATESPEYALLIKALPGVGKTTAAVKVAEDAALSGRRVLYSGPRHDFYADLMNMADRPTWWYEWCPPKLGARETRPGLMPPKYPLMARGTRYGILQADLRLGM
jgi:hypothetical protein